MRRLLKSFIFLFAIKLTVLAYPESIQTTSSQSKPDDTLRIGSDGILRFSALLQGWFVAHKEQNWMNTFRLRRAEIGLKGSLADNRCLFGLMIDPAKVLEGISIKFQDAKGETITVTKTNSTISALQDFYVTFSTGWADISIGQFKIPLSFEGFHSSGELIFVEHALLSRGLAYTPLIGRSYKEVADQRGYNGGGYGDKRDLGIKAEKQIGRIYYFVGLFNGTGANQFDVDNRKDLAVRLEVFPTQNLILGLAGWMTLRQGLGFVSGAKDRAEFNIRLRASFLLLQAEYLFARDYNPKKKEMTSSQGSYGALAFTLPHSMEIAFRFGWWDLDINQDHSEIFEVTGGFHYYLSGSNANIKLNYSYYHPTFLELMDTHAILLAGQIKF